MKHTAQISKMESSVTKTSGIQKIMFRIRNHDEIFAVMSICTHMPFVYCDPDTYDDEVFIYFSRQEANQGARWLLENKNPIQLAKVDKKSRLAFFTSLYPMGVNAVCVNKGADRECVLKLSDLVRRQNTGHVPKGQARVENPELHLTALYFAQELRKNKNPVLSDEMKELNEELTAHFCEGTYIIAVEEGKGIPLLEKDGKSYQPLFTDVIEFQKFNRGKKFGAAVLEYKKIAGILTEETDSVAINPFGANILMKIVRRGKGGGRPG